MQSSVVGPILETLLESALSRLAIPAVPVAIILWVVAVRKLGALFEDLLRHRWVHATADWVAVGVERFRTTQQNRYGHWRVVRIGLPLLIAFCCFATGLMLFAFSGVLGANVLWVAFVEPSSVPTSLWVLAILSPFGAMVAVDILVDSLLAFGEARQLSRNPDARP